YLPKKATIDDFLEEIIRKLSLPGPTSSIRLFEVMNCKILNEFICTFNSPIDKIPEQATLYAEEISQEEIEQNVNDKVIQAYHFTKNPSYVHGIPFKFVIKAGELFSKTKLRLQARLGMNENDFAEVKFAIVQEVPYTKPKYIVYDNVILSDRNWTPNTYLGLDYVSKTERVGIVGDDNKSIYIKE
ncbi:1692_t:CDS:2, partial [Cetraspora pellucida]